MAIEKINRGIAVVRGLDALYRIAIWLGIPVASVATSVVASLEDLPWTTALGLGLIVGMIILAITMLSLAGFGTLRPTKPPPSVARRLPWGIMWDFEGFLGGSRRQNELAYIGCVQIKGFNRSWSPVQIDSAEIVSHKTGQSIPVRLRTTSGYCAPNEANPIPAGTEFRMQVLFYDPQKNNEREGLPEDDFKRDWGSFAFQCSYRRRVFERTFDRYEVEAQIVRLYPSGDSVPRVTKK